MINLPKNAKLISVDNTTVDFYNFKLEGINYFYFDSSLTAPPEPMVNANAGLNLIKTSIDVLLMINHKIPMALLTKVDSTHDIDIEELKDDNVQISFKIKT